VAVRAGEGGELAERARRCWGDGDERVAAYHDHEWGRPVTSERGLYERVCLEAFQSGISWSVVLAKRPGLREALAGFDPERLAGWGPAEIERLLGDPRVIRNRRKLQAVVDNARATLALRTSAGGLPELVWSLRPPPAPAPLTLAELPARTPASGELAARLRRHGFRFVGPTTAYALMQACGLVNDHLAGCWVRTEVEAEQAAVTAPGQGGGGGPERP
jgi:DNA-3-methyladenine glycosylase I